MLICQPYKNELLPHWRFKTPEIVRESSEALWQMFLDYVAENDFVGADMARKFLQMGYTRARRYANYKGGRKYDKENSYAPLPRDTGDAQKIQSAAIFHAKWQAAEANERYKAMKAAWPKG